MQIGGIFGKLQQIFYSYHTEIAMKSPVVYTCDKSCIEERDENCSKNVKRDLTVFSLYDDSLPSREREDFENMDT